jgi:hypothetical protein
MAFQTMKNASCLDHPLSSTGNGTSLIETTDLQENAFLENANRGNATETNESLDMNGYSNGIDGCGDPVQPTTKTELQTSPSGEEAEKKIEPTEQKRISQRRPMFEPCDQLKAWRDFRRSDDDESADLRAEINKIKDSIVPLTSEYSGAVPVLNGTYAGPSQSSQTVVSQLLATSRAEDSVLINTLPSRFAPRAPEWRSRVPNLLPLTGDGIAQIGFGDAQFSVMASLKRGDLAYDLRKAVLKSGYRNILSQNGPLFNQAVGTPLPPLGSYEYASRQNRPLPSSPSSAANNENLRPGGPRTAPSRTGSTSGYQANGLNPALPPFNQSVTQTVPATPIIRPMELTSNQLFPFPAYPEEEASQARTATLSVPSTIRVTNDLSTQFASAQEQTEFETTGYHRDDPTVLWADTMPFPIVPSEERYPASSLLGNGFLSSLSLDAKSFVEPNAPPSLPQELHGLLLEKAERIRRHAEGDLWRAQHAADVIRRHEETVFQKKAQEGDLGLTGWHMSGEYHGKPRYGKGSRGGFDGLGGRGSGRGGRGGRGRGDFGGPGGMGQAL